MERMESTSGLLNLMIQPAFTVKNGEVELVNEAARKYLIEPGTAVADLLRTGEIEYRDLEEGCLYLTVFVAGIQCGASVRRMEDFDLFTLEQEDDRSELQAMALAAQELRSPLSNVMTVADQLFPVTDEGNDPAVKDQISKINRGLFQMLRIISNMSDAYRYSQQLEPRLSMHNITEVVAEIFEQAATLLRHGNIELEFTNLNQPAFSLADKEKLERAIFNMLSNAVKFSNKDGHIRAGLTRRNNMLYLSVEDCGAGINPELQGDVHARFRRQPRLEDRRFGIGLGIVLIRSAAATHGGTVLIDHPEGCGTRITMSMAIQQNDETVVRSSGLQVDYAGERNHCLIEFSEVLPAFVYESDKIN